MISVELYSYGIGCTFTESPLELLLFLTFSVLVAYPKNYFIRWPIPLVFCRTANREEGKENRKEKQRVCQR